MPRYRLLPAPSQQVILRDHCGHARFVWNLAVEQHSHWRPGRESAPGYQEHCRQLTQARAENPWLAAGSQTVQQQALRDFAQAMAGFFDPHNPAHRPSWRKAGRNQGFRIVVGVDRGVAVSAALSTGERPRIPGLTEREKQRMRRLERTLARAKRGSNRRAQVRHAIGRLKARDTDRRKDWVEKVSTNIARRFDWIKVEDLKVSQARFVCTACGFACHADLNAARNIAAGHAVTARGGDGAARPVNREPQLLASLAGRE